LTEQPDLKHYNLAELLQYEPEMRREYRYFTTKLQVESTRGAFIFCYQRTAVEKTQKSNCDMVKLPRRKKAASNLDCRSLPVVEVTMSKILVLMVLGIGALALFAGCAPGVVGQAGQQPVAPKAEVVNDSSHSADDGGYLYPIPPANMEELAKQANARKARAARMRANVQAVIDYIQTHHRFPPRTQSFNPAQQVVMDFIRIHQRVPTSAGQVSSPVQAILDYIRLHRRMPPRTDATDPAVEAVTEYIRLYNRVPTSASSVP
jgi:hypothetical protein